MKCEYCGNLVEPVKSGDDLVRLSCRTCGACGPFIKKRREGYEKEVEEVRGDAGLWIDAYHYPDISVRLIYALPTIKLTEGHIAQELETIGRKIAERLSDIPALKKKRRGV